jgi:uncharacterized membrane protein (DUF2068 family)
VSAVVAVLFFTVLDREALLADYIPSFVTLAWIVVMSALAIPHLVAGIGLLRLKPWARPLGMVLCTFSLLNVPLGTAVGLYGLSVLMSPEADEVFSPRFERD